MGIVSELKTLIEREKLQRERKQQTPTYTTLIYASQTICASKERVMAAAKELEEWGLITIGRTINDYYFSINEENTDQY